MQNAYLMDGQVIDLNQVLLNTWSKRRFIILLTLCIVFLSLILFYFKPKVFESNLLLEVQPYPTNKGFFEPGLLSSESYSYANLTHLIRSRFILEPVIQHLHLDVTSLNASSLSLKTFSVPLTYIDHTLDIVVKNDQFAIYDKKHLLCAGDLGKKINHNGFSIQVDAPDTGRFTSFKMQKLPLSQVLKKLQGQLNVSTLSSNAAQTGGVLQIKLKGREPNQIIATLNQIALEVQLKDKTYKTQYVDNRLQLLEKQLPFLKKNLNEAEFRLNQYQLKHGKLNLKLQTESLERHLTEIENQITALRIQKAEGLQEDTAAHPFIISLDHKLLALTQEKNSLLLQLEKLSLEDPATLGLRRDIQAKNNLYLSTLKNRNELQMIKNGFLSEMIVLSPSNFATEVYPLNLSWVIAASFFIGLLLSFVLVFIWQLVQLR